MSPTTAFLIGAISTALVVGIGLVWAIFRDDTDNY